MNLSIIALLLTLAMSSDGIAQGGPSRPGLHRPPPTMSERGGFAVPLGHKDIRLVLAAGEELRVPLPLAKPSA